MTLLLGPSGAACPGGGALPQDHGDDALLSAGSGLAATLQRALFSQSAEQGQDLLASFRAFLGVPGMKSAIEEVEADIRQ